VSEAHVLRVGSAFPDPPFEVAGPPPTGFDVALTQAIAGQMGWAWELHRYDGTDFEGIFAGLADGTYDVVASGTTVTPHRRALARFCRPYLRSGQSLVVAASRTPAVASTADLAGGVIGVQRGNTSQPVVQRLCDEGRVGRMQVYDYHDIGKALDDVESGAIDGFMKLEPVTRWLVRDRPSLRVAQVGITREELALSVGRHDADLAERLDQAQRSLAATGHLTELGRRWLASSDPAATALLA
jgi:ABC-type amino acid transport substrate-binding protein